MMRLFLILVLATAVFGQESQPAKPQVLKVIPLKHANPDQLRELLGIFNATTRAVENPRAIAVSGSPETVAAMEEVINRFDVPPKPQPFEPRKNIELTFHLIAASKTGTNQPIAGMETVTRNLQSTFGYTVFELIDTMQLRVLDQRNGQTASLASFRNLSEPIRSWVRVDPVRLAQTGSSATIQLGNLRFNMRTPVVRRFTDKDGTERTSTSFTEEGLETSIDIHEGQKVVVGKANMAGPEFTVFLVVSGKVVD